MTTNPTKDCPHCLQTLPLTEFHQFVDKRYGKRVLRYESYCIACNRIRSSRHFQAVETEKKAFIPQEPTSKRCPHCEEILPITEFGITKDRSTHKWDSRRGTLKPIKAVGRIRYQSWCKECNNHPERISNAPSEIECAWDGSNISEKLGLQGRTALYILQGTIRRLWRDADLRRTVIAKERGFVSEDFRVAPLDPLLRRMIK